MAYQLGQQGGECAFPGELNLTLDSTVFIDDNPAERGRIREAYPDVLVPEWPEDPRLYARALARLDCFDLPTVSNEDRTRTLAYVAVPVEGAPCLQQ